jgi:histone-lysine N-methyltransferase SETMAR
LLSNEEKETRVHLSTEFLRRHEVDQQFLSKIESVDETWLHYYDPEDKRQSSVWKTAASPPPKKAKVTKSMGKHMFIVFIDRKGVLLCHAVPLGQTVNSAYYSKVGLKLNSL